MEGRLFSGDQSLNVQLGFETDAEWQDMLVDESDNQDIIYEKKDEYNHRKKLFLEALKILNPREKEIIKLRRLSEKPKKLEELSIKFKISRERVRQIEEKAMEKLQKEISNII
jgi:RNA polymerase sigma-32 factor